MAPISDFFSVQVFFIVLRETIELAIIISVLLAFVKQSLQPGNSPKTEPPSSIELNPPVPNVLDESNRQKELRRLKWHIWVGGLCGFLVCLMVGAIILTVFYLIGNNLWALAEHYWECAFSILASVIISVMGVKILRVTKMQDKWRSKLGHVMKQYSNIEYTSSQAAWSERYAMFLLPFVTTLREGLEAIVFVGGIGINDNTSIWSIFNATIVAMAIGAMVGVVLYRSGNTLSLRVFLITSTCFLYMVAAGLFSKGIWTFELQKFINACDGLDVSETGHGPGSYDIATSVWHVNCCNGELPEDGVGWMLFTAIFGWTNSATYGSVIGYNLYWLVVIAVFVSLAYEERKGYLPVIRIAWQQNRIEKRNFARLGTEDTNNMLQDQQVRGSVDSTTPLNAHR